MKHAFSATATDATTTTSQAVDVQCGWDRQLQHHFLTVSEAGQLPDGILYTSLMERTGGLPDADAVADELEKLGIEAPEGLMERLYLDEAFNEGNGFKQW